MFFPPYNIVNIDFECADASQKVFLMVFVIDLMKLSYNLITRAMFLFCVKVTNP